MIKMKAEDEMFQTIANCIDLNSVNQPPSDEFMINGKGDKLHIRSFWPTFAKPKALVFSLHGYASHCNRPTHKHIAKVFTQSNIAYITFDFHGHGYSEGLKALIESGSLLVDEALQIIQLFYSDESVLETGRYKVNSKVPSGVPFFVLGHSMGGTCALMVSSTCIHMYPETFRGCLLFCPALEVSLPPPFVLAIFEYILLPLIPEFSIPAFMSSMKDPHNTWANEDYIKYIKNDSYPDNPKGLSWGPPLRIKTAHSLIRFIESAKETIPTVNFPFIVFHDSNDAVVPVSGSHNLMTASATQDTEKEFVEVQDGLHDLLANQLEDLTEKSLEWILKRLKI